MFTFVNIHLWF